MRSSPTAAAASSASSISPACRTDRGRRRREPTPRRGSRPAARAPSTRWPAPDLLLALPHLVADPEHVLDVVAVLVGDDVLRGEVAGRTELVLQLLRGSRGRSTRAGRPGSRTAPSSTDAWPHPVIGAPAEEDGLASPRRSALALNSPCQKHLHVLGRAAHDRVDLGVVARVAVTGRLGCRCRPPGSCAAPSNRRGRKQHGQDAR